jgi:hypothetical protein
VRNQHLLLWSEPHVQLLALQTAKDGKQEHSRSNMAQLPALKTQQAVSVRKQPLPPQEHALTFAWQTSLASNSPMVELIQQPTAHAFSILSHAPQAPRIQRKTITQSAEPPSVNSMIGFRLGQRMTTTHTVDVE